MSSSLSVIFMRKKGGERESSSEIVELTEKKFWIIVLSYGPPLPCCNVLSPFLLQKFLKQKKIGQKKTEKSCNWPKKLT
jgi:hypothetical protein